ncbi:MAG: alpha/beta hydrolase [Candidatus Heimdallarchaeaceae archaeon]
MTINSEIGFLLIHGLGSSHKSTKTLVDYLLEKGYLVDNIDLPSHNTTPEDLQRQEWKDWVNYAQKRLEKLQIKCERTYISGVSLGGRIALYLGANNPDISGLMICSTALEPVSFLTWILYHCSFIRYFVKWINVKKQFGKKLGLPESWETYEKLPISSVTNTAKLVKNLRKIVHKVSQPIIVIYSIHDKLVTLKGSQNILNRVSSTDKQLLEIEKGGHAMLLDEGCNIALEQISVWLENRL